MIGVLVIVLLALLLTAIGIAERQANRAFAASLPAAPFDQDAVTTGHDVVLDGFNAEFDFSVRS